MRERDPHRGVRRSARSTYREACHELVERDRHVAATVQGRIGLVSTAGRDRGFCKSHGPGTLLRVIRGPGGDIPFAEHAAIRADDRAALCEFRWRATLRHPRAPAG